MSVNDVVRAINVIKFERFISTTAAYNNAHKIIYTDSSLETDNDKKYLA